jgi:hypothetical protein
VAAGSGDEPRTAVPAGKPRTIEFDTSVAHPARVRDYLLGGKDNYEADRAAADHVVGAAPFLAKLVRADRAFLASAVRYLAADLGIRQFLDIGTGFPATDNTHEVAQKAAPESRVVYVDFDPVVLAHARALLIGTPEGGTAYVEADARDTAKILAAAEDTLDFSRPVAVMMLSILPFIPDEDDPWGITTELMAAVPPGSYLAVSHGASDIKAEDVAAAGSRYNEHSPIPLRLRPRAAFTRFFDGLELAGPGVVPVNHWQPAPLPDDRQEEALPAYAALGRKTRRERPQPWRS